MNSEVVIKVIETVGNIVEPIIREEVKNKSLHNQEIQTQIPEKSKFPNGKKMAVMLGTGLMIGAGAKMAMKNKKKQF